MHSQLVHSHPIPNTSQFAQFVVHDSQRPISMVQPPHALPEQPQDAAYATLTPVWSSQDSVDSSIQVVAEGDADVHQTERRASPIDV